MGLVSSSSWSLKGITSGAGLSGMLQEFDQDEINAVGASISPRQLTPAKQPGINEDDCACMDRKAEIFFLRKQKWLLVATDAV